MIPFDMVSFNVVLDHELVIKPKWLVSLVKALWAPTITEDM